MSLTLTCPTIKLLSNLAILIDDRVIKVMDLKTPGSGESAKNLWGNLDCLARQDQLKFVICDRADYDWANDGSSGAMDFENIAQHELGHAFGLGHPRDDCTNETMFRFADFGETMKRDLHYGDIAGISSLY